MIGLGNVNNSTDLNKPISNATQTALNLKADSDDTYTKTEVDNNLLLKQDLLAVLSLPGQISLLNGNLIKPLQSGANITITDAGTHVVIASTAQSSANIDIANWSSGTTGYRYLDTGGAGLVIRAGTNNAM